MKLIICYTAGDGCSWHSNIILPIEYSSEEALICDFDAALTKAIDKKDSVFIFGDQEFDVSCFFAKINSWDVRNKKPKIYEEMKILPDFYTLETWFDKNKINSL